MLTCRIGDRILVKKMIYKMKENYIKLNFIKYKRMQLSILNIIYKKSKKAKNLIIKNYIFIVINSIYSEIWDKVEDKSASFDHQSDTVFNRSNLLGTEILYKR